MACNCKRKTNDTVKQPTKIKAEDNKQKIIQIFYGV